MVLSLLTAWSHEGPIQTRTREERLRDMDLTEKASESSSQTRLSSRPSQILTGSKAVISSKNSGNSLSEKFLARWRSQTTFPIFERTRSANRATRAEIWELMRAKPGNLTSRGSSNSAKIWTKIELYIRCKLSN